MGISPYIHAIEPQKKKVSHRDKIKNARLFVSANFEKNIGNIKRAEKLYLQCLSLDPYDAASHYELGNIYLAMERFEEARIHADKAVRLDPSNDYYKVLLAEIYKVQTAFSESIQIIKALSEKNPGKYDYLRELAYLYILTQDYENALSVLNKIEKKTGLNEVLSNQKQQLYISLNKPEKAIEEIERLIKEFPYEVKYLGLLAEMSNQYGYEDKALEAYKKIIEINPDDPYVHISLFDFYRKKKDEAKALKQLKIGFANPDLEVDAKFQILLSFYTAEQIYSTKLKEATELVNIMDNTHPDNTRILGIKGDLLYRDKKYKEARELVKKVIEKEKNQYQWHELLVIINSELRDTTAMEHDSKKAIKLFPTQPLPYMVLGLAKIQQKNFAEAKQAFLNGLKYTGTNDRLKAQFYSYLGDCLHELEEEEASDEYYEKALKIDTANSIVLNNYAYYLALRGEKLDKANEMSAKAVELDPNSSNLDTRAWVLYKMGKYEEALIWIEKALKADNRKSTEIYEHYGDILFKLGQKKKAIKNWKKAKEIGEGSEFLDKKIKEKKLYE